jgi:uncharacterized RDD family membrane protein YckC
MMNDSVREELEIKAAPAIKPVNLERKGVSAMSTKPNQPKIAPPPKPIFTKRETGELVMKAPPAPPAPEPKTPAPTLVEFQSKNAAVPDWRLKMQNAVRQRMENPPSEEKTSSEQNYQTRLVTSGANALKAEVVEEKSAPALKNEKVANALKRIEQSRKAFFVEEAIETPAEENSSNQNKNYPFYIAARTAENAPKPAETKASVNVPPKPKLVATATTTAVLRNTGELDTNKLPPIPPKVAASFEKATAAPAVAVPGEAIEPKKDEIVKTAIVAQEAIEENIIAVEEDEIEESDDLAPFAMRFNAGLFDLIIGSFASLILLSPFMITGGEWFTFTGILAFVATTAIVMFVYMTTALGMFGRTIGMRLFSLELVDIEENEYPTFHQAAVSSSVYLLSLVCGGLGFLTVLFNEEKRAVHDIVSGTIVVKEY